MWRWTWKARHSHNVESTVQKAKNLPTVQLAAALLHCYWAQRENLLEIQWHHKLDTKHWKQIQNCWTIPDTLSTCTTLNGNYWDSGSEADRRYWLPVDICQGQKYQCRTLVIECNHYCYQFASELLQTEQDEKSAGAVSVDTTCWQSLYFERLMIDHWGMQGRNQLQFLLPNWSNLSELGQVEALTHRVLVIRKMLLQLTCTQLRNTLQEQACRYWYYWTVILWLRMRCQALEAVAWSSYASCINEAINCWRQTCICQVAAWCSLEALYILVFGSDWNNKSLMISMDISILLPTVLMLTTQGFCQPKIGGWMLAQYYSTTSFVC